MRANLNDIIALLEARMAASPSPAAGAAAPTRATSQALMTTLSRSFSDPQEAAAPAAFDPSQVLLRLVKAASDGIMLLDPSEPNTNTRRQVPTAKLTQGLQQFTPVTLLRLVSDGEAETVTPPSAQAATTALASDESKEVSSEVAPAAEVHLIDYVTPPKAELHHYTTSGTCTICFTNQVIANETPRACNKCDTLLCVECLHRRVKTIVVVVVFWSFVNLFFLFRFSESTIEAALYAVPVIHCPG